MAEESKAVIRKSTVELVKDGSRLVSTRGYRLQLFLRHLQEHLLKGTWCDVGCFAKTFFGRNSEMNRREARARMRRAFVGLLATGYFLVIEYAQHGNGHHGEIQAAKLLPPENRSPVEQQAAEMQLDRMLRRKEISEGNYQRALLMLKK